MLTNSEWLSVALFHFFSEDFLQAMIPRRVDVVLVLTVYLMLLCL